MPRIVSFLLFLLAASSLVSGRRFDATVNTPSPEVNRPLSLHRRNSSTTVAMISNLALFRGGAFKKNKTVAKKKTKGSSSFDWFKPGASPRLKWLAFWLLFWNSIALIDALMFTFRPSQNLDGYLVGEWGPHALAQTRMLANCQLALITTVALVGWTGDERTIKNMFKILILATLGAFRAVAAGVAEGTIKAPWKTGYAAVMSLPPLLLLSYFAFV